MQTPSPSARSSETDTAPPPRVDADTPAAEPVSSTPRHDTWARRHATLIAWKAGRTLDRARGELRSALDDDSALEPEVRALLTRAAASTAEAAGALEELRSYLGVRE